MSSNLALVTSPAVDIERTLEALRAARGAGPARFKGTAWEHRTASAERSGRGQPFDLSTSEFVAQLSEAAAIVIPKGEGPCFSMGASAGGGSTDLECTARFGLTLDFDTPPAPATPPWQPLSEQLRSLGIAHVVQERAGKFHLLVPYVGPWELEVSPETLRDRKNEYVRLVTFLIQLFEAVAGVPFDRHEAARLLGLVYVVTPRTEGEIVNTVGFDGVGLDLPAFVAYFMDELMTPEAPKARPFAGASKVYADTAERIRRCQAYLEKVPPAIQGQGGDAATLRAAMVATSDFDLDDPQDVLEALRPYNAGCQPQWEEFDLLVKIENALRYASGERGSKCAAAERRPRDAEPQRAPWNNKKGDPNCGPLVQFKPAKQGEPGAFADAEGKWFVQIQPTTGRLTRQVQSITDTVTAMVILGEGTGTRFYDILPNKLVRATDDDGLRVALTRAIRALMGGVEPEPRVITTALQLICDRARAAPDLKVIRWAGETGYALHEIPVPSEGDWSAHKEFIDRCSCPRTVMAWVWTCFLHHEQTGRESLYLQGPGQDGKSYWAEALMIFLGPVACASEILKDNRFELANIVDKRLVYFGDTRNPRPIHPKRMREIISGALLPFERKGKDMTVGYFHPRCLFTSNVHFKIDSNDRAEFTRIRKIIVSPLKDNAGDQGWKRRLIEQMPAFLFECRKVYETFATPGQDLPITDACRAALVGGSEAIDEEFDFLSSRLEVTGDSGDFIEAKRLVDLFDLARYRSWDRTNAYSWLRSRGATNKNADGTKAVKKIAGRTVAVWRGLRELSAGPFRDVTRASTPDHPASPN